MYKLLTFEFVNIKKRSTSIKYNNSLYNFKKKKLRRILFRQKKYLRFLSLNV
uniref:Uncharacterized protein n=1 Tax=Babesia duncani TaxID=323732 RepID=A0A385GNL5_9APIC|nr:hypothetical protein [Babesia duncani]